MSNTWLSVALGVVCSAVLQVACSDDSNPPGQGQQGGASGNGGATTSGGASSVPKTGGTSALATGGSVASTSTTANTTGATTASGGASTGTSSSPLASGGAAGGGAAGSGGLFSGGGPTGSGGLVSSGGVMTGGVPGTTTELGGSTAVGGADSGGSSTSAGSSSGGASAATGGTTAEITATGGSISGGTSATGGTTGCTSDPDTCPKGQYCGPSGDCIKGCKENADCVSNVCNAAHDCASCVSDEECSVGLYCSSGFCLGACTVEVDAGAGCGDGFTCCTDTCANTSIDVVNCGGCGIECTAQQFCAPAGCTDAVIANLCEARTAVGVLVETRDDDATRTALAALESCSVESRESLQSSGEVLNKTTGQPTIRGELLVAFGGDAFQTLVRYEETRNHFTPVYSTYSNGNWQFLLSSNDQVVAELPNSELSRTHDIFVLETLREPATGVPLLLGYGLDIGGTTAAAWYFSNVVLPSIATFTNSWYVFEWTAASDAGPTSVDEFVLKAAG